MVMTWSTVSENDLSQFPAEIREKYRILLQKFKSLNVVFDEHKRNTRDIIEDDNEAGLRGSARRRPKTPASVTWLFRSLRDEILRLQGQHRTWKHHVKSKHSECLQVSAMMIDLENNLRIATQGMEALKETKDMAATLRIDSPVVNHNSSSPQLQLPVVPVKPPSRDNRPLSQLSTISKHHVEPEPMHIPDVKDTPPTVTPKITFAPVPVVVVPKTPPQSPPKVTFQTNATKPPSPPTPPPPEKIQKTRTRLSFKRQDTFDMPRLSRERSSLHIPRRQKTMIITTQSHSCPVQRRNSIPLRRQSTVVDFPMRPSLLYRQKSQIGFPFGSGFPEMVPLPPIGRSKTFVDGVSTSPTKRPVTSAVAKEVV